MLKEAVDLLNCRPGLTWVDATAGAGGHLKEIIERCGGVGTVIGIDRDPQSIAALEAKLGHLRSSDLQLHLVHANYDQLDTVLSHCGLDTVSGGILADLGVSSMQLDQAERGFSFMHDGPLDMRMDTTGDITAEQLINSLSERELANIIYRFGEERLSRSIARMIVENRPIYTTATLSALVSRVVERHRRQHRSVDSCHPATRTFQALRMAVNKELESLEAFLKVAANALAPGGRLSVITFHSLEDRLVKHFLKEMAVACICPPRQPICTCQKRVEMQILTRKPLQPFHEEVLANPRSRSAKLRAGEKSA